MSAPVLVVGGVGRMEGLYRACAKSLGHTLLYAEKKLGGTPPRVRAVLIFVGTCSHPLKAAAEEVARVHGAPIHYLRKPSVSCLRHHLGELAERVEVAS